MKLGTRGSAPLPITGRAVLPSGSSALPRCIRCSLMPETVGLPISRPASQCNSMGAVMQPNPFLDKVRRVVRITGLFLFLTLISIHSLPAQNLESIGSPAFLQFAPTNFVAVPGATNAIVTVTRCNNTSEPVSVDFQTQDGTAVVGRDYVAAAGTLDFAVGETQKVFSVTILPAAANRIDLTINLSLFTPTYSGEITSGAATLTIAGMPRLTIVPAGNGVLQISTSPHRS